MHTTTIEPAETSASLRDRAYRLLRDMIADGRLRPGDHLLEAQVAKAFGISRSPARGALVALESDALIRARAGRGFEICGERMGAAGRAAVLESCKISVVPQWERMYTQVEQELFTHVLFCSVRLNERLLAEHFNVSRTVTRELLTRMNGMGLVSKAETGHWVAPRITPERIRHFFELRILLEPEALRQAADHLRPAELTRARRHVEAMLNKLPPSSADFDRAETDLHVTALARCPNTEILRALARAHFLFGPTRHLLDPLLGLTDALIRAALEEHREIFGRLEAGEADEAAALLGAHIAAAEGRWIRRLDLAGDTAQAGLPDYLTRVEAD